MLSKQLIINDTLQWKYNKKDQILRFGNQPMYWADIMAATDWSLLKQLSIQRSDINDNNIDILLKMNWPELVELCLSLNKLTVNGIRNIVNKNWNKLNSLSLCSNEIKDEGMLSIIRFMGNKLIKLKMFRCGITAGGIREIIDHRMINLKFLLLGGNDIGNFGAKWLGKTDFPNLEELRIYECKIEYEGFKHINKAQWPNLTDLWLGFDFQQNNRMNLSSWQILYQNCWKWMKKIAIRQVQPACLIHCVLLQGSTVKLFKYYIRIKNEEIKKSFRGIFIDRQLI